MTVMENVNFTPLFEAGILLVSFLITYFLIPWLKTKKSAAELDKALTNMEMIFSMIDKLVTSAEQKGDNEELADGTAKKSYVVSRLQAMGITVDDTVDDYIEAAVKELHESLKTETVE